MKKVSILSSLLSGLAWRAGAAAPGVAYSGPKPTHLQRATRVGDYYYGCQHFNIDWKSLERNKYAPWGRGHNSGLPLEHKSCQDTRINPKVIGSIEAYRGAV